MAAIVEDDFVVLFGLFNQGFHRREDSVPRGLLISQHGDLIVRKTEAADKGVPHDGDVIATSFKPPFRAARILVDSDEQRPTSAGFG